MPVKSVQYAYMDCAFKRQEMKINLAHMHGLSQSERLPRQKKKNRKTRFGIQLTRVSNFGEILPRFHESR